jgi:hypothetical protein
VILVDTSVWIAHLRAANATLLGYLSTYQVACHDFILGELAVGSLHPRTSVMQSLGNLPRLPMAKPAEVLHVIETRQLHGVGIGYVDAHLLASLLIAPGTRLMTADRRLAASAERCGVRVVTL